jgi:hypothetical protein
MFSSTDGPKTSNLQPPTSTIYDLSELSCLEMTGMATPRRVSNWLGNIRGYNVPVGQGFTVH